MSVPHYKLAVRKYNTNNLRSAAWKLQYVALITSYNTVTVMGLAKVALLFLADTSHQLSMP